MDLSVTATQYNHMMRWAEGDFTTGNRVDVIPFEDLTPEEQTQALLRAPLEECLGGPFHPGIELTWPLRNLMMWTTPWRLKVLPEDRPVRDDYGPILTPDIALGKGGPLDGSGPGTLTRWLGVPWQTDEASCLSGYDTTLYLPLPSFWAARVPNYVLSMNAYNRALASSLNVGQRMKHFANRVSWLRDFPSSYTRRINAMVTKWDQLGVIMRQATPSLTSPFLPEEWWVETARKYPAGQDPTYRQTLIAEKDMEKIVPPAGPLAVRADAEAAEGPRESKPFKRHEL